MLNSIPFQFSPTMYFSGHLIVFIFGNLIGLSQVECTGKMVQTKVHLGE